MLQQTIKSDRINNIPGNLDLIHKQQTLLIANRQFKVISMIFNKVITRFTLPATLIDCICIFTFPNPTVFRDEFYINERETLREEQKIFWYENISTRQVRRLQILRRWESQEQQKQPNKIICIGKQVVDLFHSLNLIEYQNGQVNNGDYELSWGKYKKRIKIITANPSLMSLYLKQLITYRKTNIPNESFFKALKILISSNIIALESSAQVDIYIQTPYSHQYNNEGIMQFKDGQWKLSSGTRLWTKANKLIKRSQLTIMDKHLNMYNINDYFIQLL